MRVATSCMAYCEAISAALSKVTTIIGILMRSCSMFLYSSIQVSESATCNDHREQHTIFMCFFLRGNLGAFFRSFLV